MEGVERDSFCLPLEFALGGPGSQLCGLHQVLRTHHTQDHPSVESAGVGVVRPCRELMPHRLS